MLLTYPSRGTGGSPVQCRQACTHCRGRRAITLIELLVAISIIALLAGMVVAFYPGMQEQQRSAEGGVLVEGWLRVAKVRAQLNGKVSGLRLLLNGKNSNNLLEVTQCQYIEDPGDYSIAQSNVASMSGSTISFTSGIDPATGQPISLDFFNGTGGGANTEQLWLVQPGDNLLVNGVGQPHEILAVLPGPGQNSNISYSLALQPIMTTTLAAGAGPGGASVQITLANAPNVSIGCCLDIFDTPPTSPYSTPSDTVLIIGLSGNVATVTGMTKGHLAGAIVQSHGISVSFPAPGSSWKVVRAPRIAAGSEVLELPTNIVIDLNQNLPGAYGVYSNPVPFTTSVTGTQLSLDIMFAPSGTVQTPGVSGNFIALWVRDLSAGANGLPATQYQLSPTLIAVYIDTGLIAAHPVNDAGPDPYMFVRDGRSQ